MKLKFGEKPGFRLGPRKYSIQFQLVTLRLGRRRRDARCRALRRIRPSVARRAPGAEGAGLQACGVAGLRVEQPLGQGAHTLTFLSST